MQKSCLFFMDDIYSSCRIDWRSGAVRHSETPMELLYHRQSSPPHNLEGINDSHLHESDSVVGAVRQAAANTVISTVRHQRPGNRR